MWCGGVWGIMGWGRMEWGRVVGMGVIGIDRLGCGRVGCLGIDWGWGRGWVGRCVLTVGWWLGLVGVGCVGG